jgi:hypothetical protein
MTTLSRLISFFVICLLAACGGGAEVYVGGSSSQERPIITSTTLRTLVGNTPVLGSVRELAVYRVYCPNENTVRCEYRSASVGVSGALIMYMSSSSGSQFGAIATPPNSFGFNIGEVLAPGETREYRVYGQVQADVVLVDMRVMTFVLGGAETPPYVAPASGACAWFIKPVGC